MPALSARESLLVETAWLAGQLDDPQLTIVDIRRSIKPATAPKPHYSAKRDAYREPHIPGAVFVDSTEDIIEPSGPVHMTLAGPARFKALGNAGVSASVGLLALRLAGFDTVSNYAGSWYEWESDPANPIEQGEP